jgi:hypothetical protein
MFFKIVQLAAFKATNKSSVVLNDLLNNAFYFTTANRPRGVNKRPYSN